ncbi:cytochrome-c oxidase [Palleronia marisminoris]|uniref:cytochrome-c oxidase n=1 Tax=Palleronia marisminoris TaxID=315423 RepID=UPI001113ADB3|nr:cytochrome-c oxidase [Palleronia marisminoris]
MALLTLAAPAFANHPEERLDEVMAERESAFEPTGLDRLPALDIQTADRELDLDALEGQIVVLSFVSEACGEPCANQQALLAEVQEAIGVTPMRDMVSFVSVASPEVSPEGPDAENWVAARPQEAGDADALAASFAALSDRDSNAPMVHVIDRGGRHAGIFHGGEFGHVSMTLYINGLSNAHPHEPGMFDRVLGMFQ